MINPHTLGTYSIQTWQADQLVSEISGVSLDAARHIATATTAIGFTVRLICDDADYCEVYSGSEVRTGTFAETTIDFS